MKLRGIKKRELFDLSLVLIISVVFALFSISIKLITRIYNFFFAYTSLPIAEFLINIIFLWLIGLLWITYRLWRKNAKKQKELEDIIESISPDLLMVVDPDRNIIMCNAPVKKMFGYEVEEIINQKTDLLYFDRRPDRCHKHEIYDLLEKDGFHVGLATGKKKNGNTIPLEIITGNLSSHSGAVVLLRDITERKLAEEELKESEERFRLTFEQAKDAIFWVDSHTGLITNCNRAAETLLEKKREEIIGYHQKTIHPPQKAEYYTKSLRKHIQQEGTFDDELEIIAKSGKIKPVHVTASLTLVGGQPIIQGIFRDITEKMTAVESIKRAYAEIMQIFNTSAEGVRVIDKDFNILIINETFSTLSGMRKDEMAGKKCYEVLNSHLCHTPDCLLTRSLDGEKSVESNIEAERKDGIRIPCILTATCFRGSDDELIGIVENFRDISEIKKADEALKKSEEKYHNLIEHANDAIISVNRNGKIIGFNKKAEEMLGYSRDEVFGKSVTLLSPPHDRERVGKTLEKLKTTNELHIIGITLEGRGLRKDGQEISVESSVFALEVDGEYIITSVIRDISEREKAEKEIKEAKDFLENVIDGSKDGIAICDEKGYIISANTALEKMCTFKKEELIGKHVSILTIEDKETRKTIREKISELFEKGFTSYESRQKIKDGNYIDVECNNSMIKDKNGNYIAGVSILRDISERKKMEQQLLQSEKLKSLGELAGGVAHDFNNVLAAILGRAQLLKTSIETPLEKQERRKSMHVLKKGLEIIEKAAADGAETVRRIQEFSRRRDDDKDFTQVDINELIDHAIEFASVRWKDEAESKGIKLRIKKEFSSLPPISGSPSELREVFTNLINNAIDAMPQGGQIKIKTFKEESHIIIKIEDTGIGIPKLIRDSIFDPFFTTKGPQSTGLGMSVSYGIINRHRGRINVDSVEGKRTTFTIKLPISMKIIKEGKTRFIPGKQKKARILVIEDEKDVRQLLADILISGGHEVETAHNGSQGIKIFKKKDFDIVFTDLGMPGMSGWQVAGEIKKISSKTPVALITGWEVQLKNPELRKRGVDLIVNKPFRLDQVLRLVQEGMEIRERLRNVMTKT